MRKCDHCKKDAKILVYLLIDNTNNSRYSQDETWCIDCLRNIRSPASI